MNYIAHIIKTVLALVLLCPFLAHSQPVGANINNPIIVGTYGVGTFTYSDTKNNDPINGFGNDYGQISDDIYYKFTIQGTAQVDISHCASSNVNTYLYLLRGDGIRVYSNDDNGPLCTNAIQASMRFPNAANNLLDLPAGTYYIISEGRDNCFGEITTNISITINSVPVAKNYVRCWSATGPELDPTVLGQKSLSDVKQTTFYLDTWGRPEQTVVKNGSLISATATTADFVAATVYDEFGREALKYLPYVSTTSDGLFKTDPITEQSSFYNGSTSPVAGQGESNFFSKTIFEASPLSRISNIKLPGNKWNTDVNYRGASSDYEINKAIEKVQIWNIDFISGSVPVSTNDANGYYADGKLIKNIIRDDKDKMIVEYKDFTGNTILKKVQEKEVGAGLDLNGPDGWLCTYYVYDDFNRLRYTIPPKAVAQMVTDHSWVISGTVKTGLCFYNEYDEKGRVIIKSSPDGGEVWMVYDNRDRLILSQDANQRNMQTQVPAKPIQWSFSLYDEFDRVLTTGLWEDPRDRAAMVTLAKGLNQGNTNINFYTGNAAPEQLNVYNPVLSVAANSIKITSVNYYDEYESLAQPFEIVANSDFATTTNAYVEPLVKSSRVLGMATGSKLLLLNEKYENSTFNDEEYLTSTTYYDEKGRVLQTLADNIRKGVDVSSVQYDWSGKVLSTNSKHRADNSSFTGGAAANLFNNLITISKTDYDDLGRGYKFYKLFTMAAGDIGNNSKYKVLSEVSFDAIGRIKTKKIGSKPSVPSTPMEIQDFTYNIQGWLTGINKDYALAQYIGNTNYHQFDKFFGLYLGYENSDNKFLASQFNGDITGAIWRSQGDNTPRKYDYEYDNINRFKKANFKQVDQFGIGSGYNWTNTSVDFSASVDQYDANGNIEKMKQYGIQPGINGGILIDDLVYTYNANSNKLKNVTDNAMPINSGKLGDFNDYASSNGIDYGYDYNGNLVFDKNKKLIDNTAAQTDLYPISGIKNNFLALPQSITIKGKSTTEYTYDAAGNKLAKKVTQFVTPGVSTTTWFAGSFVYEGDNLQYILHEEGKLRIIDPVGFPSNPPPSYLVNYYQTAGNISLIAANIKWGVWDYFIKDNLSNTRMTLTEETHQQNINCSMESVDAAVKSTEEITFGQTGSNNEVYNTRQDKPTGWAENNSAKVSKLISINGINPPTGVGPNSILKVMAGDVIATKADYFYQAPAGSPAPDGNIFNTIASSLIVALMGNPDVSGSIKAGQMATNINTPGTANPINLFFNDRPTVATTTPKAYLNIMFFDEQFKYVSTSSSAVPVGSIVSGNNIQSSLIYSNVAPKNGYVYIYLSNESSLIPVYFDNFAITHTRSPILEDNAYYPFGLKMAGISARAALKPNNRYGYQGDYCESDEETGYNEFELRNYDPQIGRWSQTDPYDEFASQYLGMGNNPLNNIDNDGGCIWCEFAKNVYTLPDVAVTGIRYLGPKVAESTFFATVGKSIGNIFGDYIYRWKINVGSDIERVKSIPGTLAGNAKRNWESGNTMIQQFGRDAMANPISLLGESEFNVVKGAFGIEAAVKGESRIWEVGLYKDLRGVEKGLTAHHVGQKALLKDIIPGYNDRIAPSILVPEFGHTKGIGNLKTLNRSTTGGLTEARDVLARDIFELRRVYPNIPNSSLGQLIKMNKTMYPFDFIKKIKL